MDKKRDKDRQGKLREVTKMKENNLRKIFLVVGIISIFLIPFLTIPLSDYHINKEYIENFEIDVQECMSKEISINESLIYKFSREECETINEESFQKANELFENLPFTLKYKAYLSSAVQNYFYLWLIPITFFILFFTLRKKII